MATIFTATLGGSSTGNQTNSTRNVIHLSADTQGQIRVTFQAGPSAGWKVTHASFQQSDDGWGAATSAFIFQELLFGGLSGFNLAAGQSITSDYLTAWQKQVAAAGGLRCVIVTDDDTAGNGDGGNIALGTGVSGAQPWSAAATSSYNVTNPGGFTSGTAGQVFGVSQIETRGPSRPITLNWFEWSGPLGTPTTAVAITPGSTAGYGGGGGTVNIGDLLIAGLAWGDQTNSGVDAGTIVPPAGWVSLGQASSGLSQNLRAGFFYKIAGAGEPSSYTFTVTTAETACWAVASYSGCSIDKSATFLDTSATGSPVAPSLTPIGTTDLLVCFWTTTESMQVGWPSAMYAAVAAQNSFSANVGQAYVSIGEEPLLASGPTGTRTGVMNAARGAFMLSIALSPPIAAATGGTVGMSTGPGIVQSTRMIAGRSNEQVMRPQVQTTPPRVYGWASQTETPRLRTGAYSAPDANFNPKKMAGPPPGLPRALSSDVTTQRRIIV